jgi:hypothetical protein
MRMFVGSDVHKKHTEVAIVDEDVIVTEQERIENERALGAISCFVVRGMERRIIAGFTHSRSSMHGESGMQDAFLLLAVRELFRFFSVLVN